MTAGERFARLDRHDLIDRLFSLFSDKPYWGIPALRATLKQPDSWLREVLKDVAEPMKEGQYANMWRLKEGWRGDAKGEGEGEGMMEADPNAEAEGREEEFVDDEDDDDFEEVFKVD